MFVYLVSYIGGFWDILSNQWGITVLRGVGAVPPLRKGFSRPLSITCNQLCRLPVPYPELRKEPSSSTLQGCKDLTRETLVSCLLSACLQPPFPLWFDLCIRIKVQSCQLQLCALQVLNPIQSATVIVQSWPYTPNFMLLITTLAKVGRRSCYFALTPLCT